MSWLLRLIGRRRLRYGFCPLCNSSPPNVDCPVCEGCYDYGPRLSDAERQRWRVRWESMLST